MRLYLSSYRLGAHPRALSALVGGGRRGVVIANALDGLDEARRHRDTARDIAELADLGLTARDLDLREHDPSSIRAAFDAPDFVWVRGGNVFTLRAAMARSGIDAVLIDGIRRNDLVYAGYSAGACVLAPNLEGLELVDPLEEARAVHDRIRFDGLGLLDRPVVPHFVSVEDPLAAHHERLGEPYWRLRDGEALVVDGDDTRLIGAA